MKSNGMLRAKKSNYVISLGALAGGGVGNPQSEFCNARDELGGQCRTHGRQSLKPKFCSQILESQPPNIHPPKFTSLKELARNGAIHCTCAR